MSQLWYRTIRGLIVVFSKVFWRLSVTGAEQIPRTGPFILAPVHRSNVDFAIVSAVTARRMRYLAKDSLWKFGLGRLWESLGAVAVARGTADRPALRALESAIASGEPVVMFPEGTRQTGPEVQPLFDGVAYVASRTGVPIIPVGIGGSERAMPKGAKMIHPVRIALVVGPPILPERREDGARVPRRAVTELTATLKGEVQRLFDEAQRAAGA
ncbi:MAG: 1-acyl-sn-glycerol-3-phosphate acyltransferase [Actinomycetota bacterium]|jgi:1-acyl-sn-glycerol-3-phosphate acyltransferase|nr:1-acyl-sn-glycerol-3-phosphate acyltransferase [Actinomycetota bacterium]